MSHNYISLYREMNVSFKQIMDFTWINKLIMTIHNISKIKPEQILFKIHLEIFTYRTWKTNHKYFVKSLNDSKKTFRHFVQV